MGRVPSRGSDQFVVRFPEGMRDRIRRAAEEAGRSMNAEIVARLEASFGGEFQNLAELEKAKETIEELRRTYSNRISELEALIERESREYDLVIKVLQMNINQSEKRQQMARIGEELAKLAKPGEVTEISTEEAFEAVRKGKGGKKVKE